MALNPTIRESQSWPRSPALVSGGFPASPTLKDLGDPVWLEAYRRSGGIVRTVQQSEDARRAGHVVSTAAQNVGVPTPNFLRRLQNTVTKVVAATDSGVARDVAKIEELLEAAPPSRLVAPVVDDKSSVSTRRATDAVFTELQEKASAWLDIFCPKVKRCMAGAHDAIARGDAESLAHGALSLRRALVALADEVEPAGAQERPDHAGIMRSVGREQFKNRLYIYLGRRTRSRAHRALTLAELELVEDQLGPFVKAVGKGLHADSAKEDLAQLYTTTWSLIARVVQCAEAEH
jgi:hypothetical protein